MPFAGGYNMRQQQVLMTHNSGNHSPFLSSCFSLFLNCVQSGSWRRWERKERIDVRIGDQHMLAAGGQRRDHPDNNPSKQTNTPFAFCCLSSLTFLLFTGSSSLHFN